MATLSLEEGVGWGKGARGEYFGYGVMMHCTNESVRRDVLVVVVSWKVKVGQTLGETRELR
jgi:hypothetical protein